MRASVRAFFALPVPATLRAELGAALAALRTRPGGDRIRWLPEANLHLTLRFLGEVPPARLPALLAAVQAELRGHAGFACPLAGTCVFPSPARPRVLALTFDGAAPLEELAAAVERGVVRMGQDPEPRAFRAHLTLGRWRLGGRAGRSRRRGTGPGSADSARIDSARIDSDSTDSDSTDSESADSESADFANLDLRSIGLPDRELPVEAVVLMRSELAPSGSRYTVLGVAPLDPGPVSR